LKQEEIKWSNKYDVGILFGKKKEEDGQGIGLGVVSWDWDSGSGGNKILGNPALRKDFRSG
jgi:hypothetical protein